MDLFDVVRSCFRRWYVVVPLLLIAAWFSHHVYASVKPVYYSQAVVSIAPPNSRLDQSELGVPVPRNGLMESGGASLIANLAVLGLRDPSVVGQVVAAGGQANYVARMFPVGPTSQELPLIMIEATESDPIAASKTVELAAAQTDPVLRTVQQQAGVPDDLMVKALPVSPPSPPAAGVPSRTRSTIAVLVAGAGAAILAGVLVDVLVMRWKARRRNRRQETVPATDPTNAIDPSMTANQTSKHAVDEVAIEGR